MIEMSNRQGSKKDYELGRWRHYTCRDCGAPINLYLRDPLPKKERLCKDCEAKVSPSPTPLPSREGGELKRSTYI